MMHFFMLTLSMSMEGQALHKLQNWEIMAEAVEVVTEWWNSPLVRAATGHSFSWWRLPWVVVPFEAAGTTTLANAGHTLTTHNRWGEGRRWMLIFILMFMFILLLMSTSILIVDGAVNKFLWKVTLWCKIFGV